MEVNDHVMTQSPIKPQVKYEESEQETVKEKKLSDKEEGEITSNETS